MRGLGPIQAGLRVEQGGLRNEALVHQCLVVVKLALGNVHLRFGRIGLLLRLAHARLVLARFDAGDDLPSLHAVAFTHVQL